MSRSCGLGVDVDELLAIGVDKEADCKDVLGLWFREHDGVHPTKRLLIILSIDFRSVRSTEKL